MSGIWDDIKRGAAQRKRWAMAREQALERTVDCDEPLCAEEAEPDHQKPPGDGEATDGE